MHRNDWLPLGFFLLAYMLTCYVGAMLLLFGPTSVRYLYAYFSGVRIPHLSSETIKELMILLHVPVISFAAAYGFTCWGTNRCSLGAKRDLNHNPPPIFPVATVLLIVSLSFVVLSLARAGAFQIAGAWLDYDKWVAGRWQLFSTLSFAEFVNVYVFMPTLTALAFIGYLRRRASLRRALLIVVPGLLLTLFLFQKKQLVVFLLIVIVSYVFYRVPSSRLWRVFTKTLIFVGLAYLIALFLPAIGIAVKGAPTSIVRGGAASADILADLSGLNEPEIPGKTTSVRDRASTRKARMATLSAIASKWRSVLYAINSVIFRTSAPAIYYPTVFPDEHPYYGIDLPFDNFSPDDNRVVWHAMWPKTPGGSVMTPIQFAFFAQAGLAGSIGLSAVAGVLLALLWKVCLRGGLHDEIFATGAALVVMLAIFFATDRARDSIAASYGLVWGGALLTLILVGRKYCGTRLAAMFPKTFPYHEKP